MTELAGRSFWHVHPQNVNDEFWINTTIKKGKSCDIDKSNVCVLSMIDNIENFIKLSLNCSCIYQIEWMYFVRYSRIYMC